MSLRRVAVTGIGIVSPVGMSTATCWGACLGGRMAVADAGLQPELTDAKHGIYRLSGIDDSRGGVFMGTDVGGITTLIETQNSHLLSPLQPLSCQPVTTGPSEATGGLDALLASLPQRLKPFPRR